MEELIDMIECKTFLTNRNIKALAKYHTQKIKKSRWKSILIFLLGIFLLIFSIINSYGIWMKYHETKSIIYILLKSSVLFILSLIILHTNIWGTTQKLYLELKKYFSGNQAKYIDYIISNDGIEMIINNTSTLYKWNSIDQIESDRYFFYFTCNDKHSLIEKKALSSEEISQIENWIK